MKPEIVRIENKRAMTMKGIFCAPDSSETNQETVALYLPGIVLGSTAVHRLAFVIAEQLALEGIATLVCDHAGVGESEGEIPPARHNDLVAQVSSGLFVEDTVDMIEWLKSRRSTKGVIIIGHCGGSVTALLAAAEHDMVRGLYLISPPLAPTSESESKLSSQAAEEYFSLYRQKIFSLQAWKKLVTGKSSYETIVKTLLKKLGGRNSEAENPGELIKVIDERLLDAVRAAAKNMPITMVIGDKDPDIEAFNAFSKCAVDFSNLQAYVFAQTSHGFVTAESLQKLRKSIRKFAQSLD